MQLAEERSRSHARGRQVGKTHSQKTTSVDFLYQSPTTSDSSRKGTQFVAACQRQITGGALDSSVAEHCQGRSSGGHANRIPPPAPSCPVQRCQGQCQAAGCPLRPRSQRPQRERKVGGLGTESSALRLVHARPTPPHTPALPRTVSGATCGEEGGSLCLQQGRRSLALHSAAASAKTASMRPMGRPRPGCSSAFSALGL